jgi:hypothetical protein
MCRRAAGSVFATLVWVKRHAIEWSEAPARYRSSTFATRGFCARCGTSLFLDYDGNDEIAVMLGAIDEPKALLPTHHYGIESRLPWVDIQDGLPGKVTDSDPRP